MTDWAGPEAVKQAQTMTLPPPCITVLYLVLHVLLCFFCSELSYRFIYIYVNKNYSSTVLFLFLTNIVDWSYWSSWTEAQELSDEVDLIYLTFNHIFIKYNCDVSLTLTKLLLLSKPVNSKN